MKKTAIALGMALSVAGTTALAGGIQIDPTGTGSIIGSKFIVDPGSSRGNMLAQNAVSDSASPPPVAGLLGGDNSTGLGLDGALGGGDDAFIYAQNSFDIGSSIPGAELTFLMTLPVTSTANFLGNGLDFAIRSGPGVPPAKFELFYDSAADAVFSAVGNAAEGSGIGYGASATSIKVAEGVVSFDPSTASGFTNTSVPAATSGPMAANNAMASIDGIGSGIFNVDFLPGFTNTMYIVNALDALTVDMSSSASLSLRYSQGPAPTPVIYAASLFGDGAVAPSHGLDGTNNFGCGAVINCDFQTQMNTTLAFNAPIVPEPATVALLGAGLAMVGAVTRRRRRAV